MARVLNRVHAIAAGLSVALLLALYLVTNNARLSTQLNQLKIAVERRIQWWDWKDTPEEQSCRSAHDPPPPRDAIPNVVNFILLADNEVDRKLTYATFLALKAAVVRLNATQARLHTSGLNTRNRWWQEIKEHVTLEIIDRSEFQAPDGVEFSSLALAHQADIVRLSILQREGGIYLNTDVYALKPFDDLLSNPRDTLLGHEGGNR